MAGDGTSGGRAAFEPDADVPAPQGSIARLTEAFEAERAHWFHWTPVLFGLGIGLYFSLGTEPALAIALAPLAAALALSAARPLGLPLAVCGGVIAIAGGFAAAKVRTEWTRAPVLERRLNGVEVSGFVELVEPRATRGVRITLRLTQLGDLPPAKVPRRARIRTLGAAPKLLPGDAIRFKATLAPPAAPAIPGGYDFARAAWFSGLGAVGYAMRAPEIDPGLRAPPAGLAWRAGVERLRQRIGARVVAALPGETGAIANALITGERGGIPAETNDAFRNSGLLHILSISGLHMVIMAGAVFYATRLALACVPRLALRYPIKKWAAVLAAVAALGYLLISGAAFATVRSYVMISIAFLAVLIDRPAIAMRNVAIAALVILTLYPESLLDTGFQMSFAAVTSLVAAYELLTRRGEPRDGAPRPLWLRPLFFLGGIVLSTLVAGLAVAPFAAYHFHTSQQFAAIANLIAIPVCNLVVMPAALATLVLMPFGLEAPALWVMGQGIEAMAWCARFAAGLPGAVGRIPAMPDAAFLVMVAGGLWLTLWVARWRWAGFAGLAAGAALAASPQLPDVLAGRDGALVAVRGADGRLAATGARRSDFELKRWLEHDGDGRTPGEARRGGLTCDGSGCVASVKGVTVAAARHASALDDDCRRARILVIDVPAPRGCTAPDLVLDFFRLRNEGTHAIYLGDGGGLRVETVASVRGERPWAAKGTLGGARPAASPAPREAQGGTAETPARQPHEDAGPPRPEIEEDEPWMEEP